MNKLVKVAVSASLSTDFYIEVPEEATKDEIKEVASKEIIIPTDYPKYLHSFLEQHFNINVPLDSLVNSWILDEFEIIVE